MRELLASNANVNEQGPDGRTALFRTARIGKESHVELLLQSNANPNITDNNDESPLQAAARYGHLEVVKMLIEAGADINHCPDPSKTAYSESPLCSAVRKNHKEVIELLLQHGAEPNAGTSACRFPLINAAWNLDPRICKKLINNGADVNQVDEHGQTALHHAITVESADIEKTIETTRLLISLGADVNAQCIHKETPIHCAISEYDKSVPLLYVLLKSFPNLTLRDDSFSETPLEKAIRRELPEQVELLRLAGAPEPNHDCINDSSSSTHCIEIEGGTIELNFEPWEAPLEDIDYKLAQELEGSSPALLKNYGWEFSAPHWKLLEHCDSPVPLTRVAYFARGFSNRPEGKELDDGPDVLGEHYEDAVNRFIEEGFLRELDGRDYIEYLAKVPDLKAISKSKKLPVSGKKSDLIDRLLMALSVDEVCACLPKKRIFVLTESGRAKLSESGKAQQRIASHLEKQIIHALSEPNLLLGLLLGTEYNSLHYHRRISIHIQSICRARLIINNPIPHEISIVPEQEKTLRAIAAAREICRLSLPDNWEHWGNISGPIYDGDPMSPSEFGFTICEDSEDSSHTE